MQGFYVFPEISLVETTPARIGPVETSVTEKVQILVSPDTLKPTLKYRLKSRRA